MRKRTKTIAVVGVLIYLVLLLLLVYAERNQTGDDRIADLWDAFWYSMVTMTTVGYGDLTPKTLPGRAIGVVFLVMSLGILAALITLAYGLLTGRVLPWLRLWFSRDRSWHIFPLCSEESIVLASALKKENPKALTIFLDGNRSNAAADVVMQLSPEEILPLTKGCAAVYYLGDTTPDVCSRAAVLAQSHERVYCSSFFPENCGMNCFRADEGCARQFWKDHPLQQEEQFIVLIGGRRWMPMLLEQALLVNVYSLDQSLQYHVYGDDGQFRQTHFRLNSFCTEGECSPGMDAVCFHEGFPQPEILLTAQRIILCRDTDSENLELLGMLQKYYALSADVYIHLNRADPVLEMPGAVPFGMAEQLYTPENVIHGKLNETAMAIHQLYCAQNPAYAQKWEELSTHNQASNIAAADHLLPKLQILLNDRSVTELTPELCVQGTLAYAQQKTQRQEEFRRLEHMRWCRFHYLRNWSYGPKKNADKRQHHLLVDFEALSEEDQAKDDNSWEVIGQLFVENNHE